MTKTAKDLVAEANKTVETLSAEDAVKLANDPGVVLVDVQGRGGAAEDRQGAGRGSCAPWFPGVPCRSDEPVTQGGAGWRQAAASVALATARLLRREP